MTQPSLDHNKLIAAEAKKVFSPLGVKRYGKSRTWYDDHGWWCTVIEFQPSSWSRGTYLNVGVSWLLYENTSWSFDVGYREQGFSEAETEEEFKEAIAKMITHAVDRVHEYRDTFATIHKAHHYYESMDLHSNWNAYHAALLAALAGEPTVARKHFDSLITQPRRYSWQQGLYYRALDLRRLVESGPEFLDSVRGIVYRTRSLLGVEELAPGELDSVFENT